MIKFTLCVLIPAYNEASSIGATINSYKAAFPNAMVVVVDNNSTDGTPDIAKRHLCGERDRLLFEPEQGKGAAVKTGLSRVSADVYIVTDGDDTYSAHDASRLLGILLQRRCEMVVGDRITGGDYMQQNERLGHSVGNAFLSRYVSALAGQKYRDVLSGLRIMSRPFVQNLDIRSDGFQLETELNIVAAYLRATVIEEPINYTSRYEGSQSKLRTIRDGGRIFSFALINWIAFFPLQAFGMLALVAFTISVSLGVWVFLVFLELGHMPYVATAIAAATAGLVGLQAIFSGIVLKIILRNSRRQDVARLVEMRRQWNNLLDA